MSVLNYSQHGYNSSGMSLPKSPLMLAKLMSPFFGYS
jgi:hypothetical protein